MVSGNCNHGTENTVLTHKWQVNTLGDVIRIQPNHLSFNTVAAIEDIHGPRSKLLKREPYITLFKSRTGTNNLLTEMYFFLLMQLNVGIMDVMHICAE
jgi:hypothetical protein